DPVLPGVRPSLPARVPAPRPDRRGLLLHAAVDHERPRRALPAARAPGARALPARAAAIPAAADARAGSGDRGRAVARAEPGVRAALLPRPARAGPAAHDRRGLRLGAERGELP